MSTPAFSFTSRARPICEIGIGSAQVPTGDALWDFARWDQPTSTWSGDEPTWRDVSCFAQYADGTLGRGRVTDAFPHGTLDIAFDNRTGWADPVLTDVDGVLSIRPGRPIRLGVEHESFGRRWLFRGFIDGVEPMFDPTEPDWVMFRCIDALGEVGRAKLADVTATGAGEFASTRVTRVLDAVPWLTTKRSIDTSSTQLVAAVLEGQVVDILRRCADSVGGACFGDNNGDVCFRNGDWLYHEADSPVDGTIGNVMVDGSFLRIDGGGPLLTDEGDALLVEATGSDICPSGWRTPFVRADLATRVILGRLMPPDTVDPPDPRQYNDTINQRQYGIEPYELLDLWTLDDADLDQIGSRILAQRNAVTLPLVQSVTIDAATSSKAVDLLTTVNIWQPSRYRCRHVLDRGTVFDDNYFATGIEFHLERDQWTAEISLDKSDLYQLTPDSARWDAARWDRSVWN